MLIQLIDRTLLSPTILLLIWSDSALLQHYGFPFNYRTLMLDYTKVTPPLSVDCHRLTQRMLSLVLDDGEGQSSCEIDREASTVEDVCPGDRMNVLRPADESRNKKRETGRSHLRPSSALTQLTVNEYLPGQGIAQHVGTVR